MKVFCRQIPITTMAAGVVLLLFSLPAKAGDSQGKILQMAINKTMGSVVFIRLDTAATAPAACSSNASWHYTLPLTTDLDKKLFALLVSAQVCREGQSPSPGRGRALSLAASNPRKLLACCEAKSGIRHVPCNTGVVPCNGMRSTTNDEGDPT